MENLTIKEYEQLIELVEKEKDSIHKQAIHDKGLRAKEIDLDFIKMKLDAQLKSLDNEK